MTPRPKDQLHPIDELIKEAESRGLRLFVAAEISPLSDLKNLRLFKPDSAKKRPSVHPHTRRLV
jgi:hypothetical protein